MSERPAKGERDMKPGRWLKRTQTGELRPRLTAIEHEMLAEALVRMAEILSTIPPQPRTGYQQGIRRDGDIS